MINEQEMSDTTTISPTEESVPFGLFEAVDTEDWNTLERYFHPQAVYERPGHEPMLGRDQVLDFYRNIRNVRHGNHQVTDIITNKENIVCQGRFSCVTKDGSRLTVEFSDFYLLNRGKILRRKTYFHAPVI